MPQYDNYILVVEDDPEIMNLYRRVLKKYPDVIYVASGTDAIEVVHGDREIGLALVDFNLPGTNGIEVIRELKRTFPAAESVVVTARDDIQSAVEAIKAGAIRYITKPFDVEDILYLVDQNREKEDLRAEVEELRRRVYTAGDTFMVVGKSKAMHQVIELAENAAGLDATVLILGETGTGKDILARVIHEKSPRAGQPFIITDCAVLNERLIESDLFGHKKGAFTGAVESRKGKFERAQGGTIFLNEIGTMPPAAQAKLLRVLESGELERVGGESTITVDVQVIAATNTDLEIAVKDGSFRADLFYRLNVITLHLPPLRERMEDIPLLTESFLSVYGKKYGKTGLRLNEEAFQIFFSYSWPGNIRELEHTIERAVIIAREPVITAADLPRMLSMDGGEKDGKDSGPTTLAENEKSLIRNALDKSNYNISQAAEILDVARGTLYSKMKKYGIG